MTAQPDTQQPTILQRLDFARVHRFTIAALQGMFCVEHNGRVIVSNLTAEQAVELAYKMSRDEVITGLDECEVTP